MSGIQTMTLATPLGAPVLTMSGQPLYLLPTVELRLQETAYFLQRFRECCGNPPIHERELEWVAYADAFVMSFVSLEEMVSDGKKSRLRGLDIFCLVKAVRNLTVHESVWAAQKRARLPCRRQAAVW
jgi:hypothetical protein